MTNEIIKSIEGSEIWVDLNARCKSKVEEMGIELTDEQYQALRNVLISKVMLEDKEVFNMIATHVWNTNNKEAQI